MSDPTLLRREDVYERLRAEILSCELLPGSSINEATLAQRFKVSKTPIRDALSRLHAQKLLLVIPRKGYRVAPISVSDATDLFEFRVWLEERCVRSACADAADEELRDLNKLRTKPGKQGFVDYNRNFHLALIELAPNRRLVEAAREVIEQFDRLVVMSLSAIEWDFTPLVKEHGAIIDALQDRNATLAGRLVVQHVKSAKKRVLGALSSQAVVP
ncbi:MAG: GntR family transcriptional regulator [Hyphomicrobiaceae bacterium]|jgi:DNA-binding GntR family transcriptional regulator